MEQDCAHTTIFSKKIYEIRHVKSNFLKNKITLEANVFHIAQKDKQGILLFRIHKIRDYRARSGLVGHSPKAPPAPVGPSRASEPPPPALASPSGVAGSGFGAGRVARLPGASAASLETGSS
jgi:hypothetical protein